METFNSKEYKWGKFYTNQNLVAVIIGTIMTLVLLISYFSGAANIFPFLFFLAISVFAFLQILFQKQNRIYIKISDDEITIFPTFYWGSTKILKWKDIMAIDTSKKNKAILRGQKGNDAKVNLMALNKDDRENFIHNVNEKIKGKSTT
ncbi:MAG: hypothetical protein JXA61_06725 [Bacteroidales bacterium]|nr:hypothetical protein [Bacteroidales bacterium]